MMELTYQNEINFFQRIPKEHTDIHNETLHSLKCIIQNNNFYDNDGDHKSIDLTRILLTHFVNNNEKCNEKK